MIKMRILEKDLRKGIVKLMPENQDDLWVLYNVIKPGDLVTALTSRDVKHEEGGSSRRIPMILTVKVKTLEFQPFTERLRIRGVVVEGPEKFGVKGHYHTINIDPGTPLIIQKNRWYESELEMLNKFSLRKQRILLVALDYDDAAIALLTEQGLKMLEEIRSGAPGKNDPSVFQVSVEKFLEKLAQRIIEYYNKFGVDAVIIASPGDLQKRLYLVIRDKIKAKVVLDSVSMGGDSGIRELVRRDSVRETVKEMSIVKAEAILEEFRRLLVKNPEMIAYGLEDVEYAVKMNAVEKLVVHEELLRTYDEQLRKRINNVLDEAYKKRAEIVVVPKHSDVGLAVEGLGGVIAVLRYPLRRN